MKKTEEKVIRFIRDNHLISEGEKILIALSGGADSVFLTYFLRKFQNKYRITLGALHVNHMLRGKAAAEDEQYCEKLCNELDIKYYKVKKNAAQYAIRKKISVEEAGRIIRYSILERTARTVGYSKIATAHNSNDNAETVLLNLIKGTGLRGLSGIPVIRGKIIRPILNLSRDEIIHYLEQKRIEYRTDETNASDIYERNFLRNKVIPLIKRLNPAFEDAVLHTTNIVKEHQELISKQVLELMESFVRKSGSCLYINETVRSAGNPVLAEVVKTALERNFSVQLSYNDVIAVSSLFWNKKGSRAGLMDGLTALKEKNEVVIFRPEDEDLTPKMISINQKIKTTGRSFTIEIAGKTSFISRKEGEEYISGDDTDDTFLVRHWQKGDRFFPFGMKGSKKVSDFLNERNIDTHLKHKILVLTNRDRIVWVMGLRLDNRFRITDNTKKVLRLCLK